jgi:hypothetical protein
LVLGRKEFNGISHFYSLPQGERKIERISPSPLPSPAGWRGKKEDEKILTIPPHPYPLPRVEREKERRIF